MSVWDNEAVFELSAGQMVADKYRVDAVVGTGGMGVVVAATHVELDQRVAIKFLRDASPEALARFQREARLLVRLKSPHVARVFDVGALDDDTPYIVMELLEGEDLGAIQKARGRVSVEDAVDWVLEATCAVAEAHAMGMVHRDLKPANLFLARKPGGASIVKVLDFGVSKLLDDRAPGETTRGGDLTNEGVALGSPGYMSPEQMTSSRDVDARSDIFSLGAILYRMLAGDAPYKGNSVVSVLAAMAIDPLKPLREVAPVSAELEAVVERCLAQDPARRYPTVAHLAQALAPFGTKRGRASADQIRATMKIDEHSLSSTLVRPLSSPAFRPSAPAIAAPAPASRMPIVLVAVAALAITVGVVVLAVFVRPSRVAADVAAPSSAPPSSVAPSAESPTTTSATLATASGAPSESPLPSVKPTHGRPKPPHHTGAPPSPTDVPASRH